MARLPYRRGMPSTAAPTSFGAHARRVLLDLVSARTWKATAHLLLDLWFGVVTFTVVVSMLALTVGLAIIVPVGIALAWATVLAARALGHVERYQQLALLPLLDSVRVGSTLAAQCSRRPGHVHGHEQRQDRPRSEVFGKKTPTLKPGKSYRLTVTFRKKGGSRFSALCPVMLAPA